MDIVARSSSVPQRLGGPGAVWGGRDTDAPLRRIRVALVTSFPPSRGDLNEYGYHLANALRDDPRVELTILADVLADDSNLQEEPAGFRVERCWRCNSILNPVRLLKAIRDSKADVVWFNIGFSTFARSPVAAFLAIAVPALARVLGYYTHVTLHTVFERINLKDAGVSLPGLYRVAGQIATRLLLLADDVSVLLPSFQSELVSKYGVSPQRVHFRPHGTFKSVQTPEASRPSQTESNHAERSRAERIILAFGYWGTYKRVDLLLESMDEIANGVPSAVLVVAGTNHPSTPGYLESLQERWLGHREVRFLGYVPEEDLPDLFRSASVLVLPYSSAAGTSGVVHQACQFGLPMVAAEIPEMVEMAREEGIAIEFYAPGDGRALANHLIRLLNSDDLRQRCSKQNLSAAQGTPMSQIVDGYVCLFQERVLGSRMQVTAS
jgi:glycosyltransferase involved in cell wall biosynthesis